MSHDGDRHELFAELDRLVEVWGPLRSRRREIKARIRSGMAAIERLQKLLAKPRRKARGPDLFDETLGKGS